MKVVYEMTYEMPADLYEDWKSLLYTKELFEKFVKALKAERKEQL